MENYTKALLVVGLLASVSAHSKQSFVDKILDGEKYVLAGVGYKIAEAPLQYTNSVGMKLSFNDPVSARIEAGMDYGNVRLGISHHSQWFTGAPFSDVPEYHKTELFVDFIYKWR